MGTKITEFVVFVNGEKQVVKDPEPDTTVLQFLRGIGLKGTKLACGEGGCGACTVMLSHFDIWKKKIVHRAVNGCLFPICSCEGKHITTIEGLGSSKTKLHPIQERMVHTHASQCGFCTPGIIMSLYSLLRNNPSPSGTEIEEAFSGNLCRCTGYRPILDAAMSFRAGQPSAYNPHKPEKEKDGDPKVSICPSSGKPCQCSGATVVQKFEPYKPDSELIFPPWLLTNYKPSSFVVEGKRGTWYRPTQLDELCRIKETHPQGRIVVGNSELGIESKMRKIIFPVLIDPTQVPELNEVKIEDHGITFGGTVTLTSVKCILEEEIEKHKDHTIWLFQSLVDQLSWFAGSQIRNAACLGGNIITASPISDINPVLVAGGAVFTLVSCGGKTRKVKAKDFFLDYRKVDILPGEILLEIYIPRTRKFEYAEAYQQCRRREDDIAIVTSGFRVQLKEHENEWIVEDISLSFGGMSKITVSAVQTQNFWKNKPWTKEVFDLALIELQKDLPLSQDAPGGMPEYRRSLSSSFLFKFFIAVLNHLHRDAPNKQNIPIVAPTDLSAVKQFERVHSTGHQSYPSHPEKKPVGDSVSHRSAVLQVTGEAQYCDDIRLPTGCLHSAIVGSKHAHAKILKVDPSAALALPGVIAWIDAKDCHSNKIGEGITGRGLVYDEEVFATKEVLYVGQPIGLIVAENVTIAREATTYVSVEYEVLPAILTIQEAIAANSFFKKAASHELQRGNVDEGFKNSDHIIEGEMKMAAQEHFYLEPHNSIVVPGENNELIIYSSTQNQNKTQHFVAHALGVPENRVVCKVKRLGGGFGGKETRSIPISCMASVAAVKLNKPVRLCLDRDEDMSTSGQRHPFVGKYKIGFTKDGKILAALVHLYSNCGFSYDLSTSVMDRALLHSDNAYKIPNMKVIGHLCKTNLATNTAFRGFGGPQGMFVAEAWIDHISRTLSIPGHTIREINMYSDGDVTHYGQILKNTNLRRLWSDAIKTSDYYKRLQEVEAYNAQSRWKKRGIISIPTKFGVSFGVVFMNQGGALVNIYLDGSVLVTHGGVEMGQGLHTKVIQCVAKELEIPVEQVHIAETATDKVPNSSPSAASVSSDLYCAAAIDACKQLVARLKPIRESHPGASFKDIVNQAYLSRVNLSAQGFYVIPDLGFDFDYRDENGNSHGKPFAYYTTGVAVTEVEIDTLTGDFTVLRSDIVMDLGESLNPAVDIGQIEGAFVQGMGWSVLEEYIWGHPEYVWLKAPGKVFTQGPSNYKIPAFSDTPMDFRVTLLPNAPNTVAVHSSKAVGEPPLFLGSSVYFAIKEAVYAARKESNLGGFFQLDSPSSCERIRMSCHDHFTAPFVSDPNFHPRGCW